MRNLVVNADDFGLSAGVNRGVILAHEAGIVTSASLMVEGPAAAAAAALARAHPSLGLGLHVDVVEWVYQDGEWRKVYERAPIDDPGSVAALVERQLALFRRLVGRDPTHLDSHQHAHREEPLRSTLARVAETLRVPLRHFSEIGYCGGFYGQTDEGEPLPEAITPAALCELIEHLPDGATELCCHPAASLDFDGAYREERLRELEALRDPSVRERVDRAGIALVRFEGPR